MKRGPSPEGIDPIHCYQEAEVSFGTLAPELLQHDPNGVCGIPHASAALDLEDAPLLRVAYSAGLTSNLGAVRVHAPFPPSPHPLCGSVPSPSSPPPGLPLRCPAHSASSRIRGARPATVKPTPGVWQEATQRAVATAPTTAQRRGTAPPALRPEAGSKPRRGGGRSQEVGAQVSSLATPASPVAVASRTRRGQAFSPLPRQPRAMERPAGGIVGGARSRGGGEGGGGGRGCRW
ncbi:hypothetical protein U0070_009187 [Myodes glareolus]|uniref:Uncharacterized protein n=1 Tax=Myodes glareolus TaxID=447135 RepID=A0AAW0H8A0_MYOGA